MKKALLALVIIFGVWFALMQIIPVKTAQAVDVTNTIDFISGVQITNTDGTALNPDVLKDAAIKLTYDFSIANTADVHEGDTFTLLVPKQIKIPYAVPFTVSDSDTNAKIADGNLSADGTASLIFTDFASKNPSVHGSFWFDLSFDKDQIGDTNLEDIVFGIGGTARTRTISVDFEQPAAPAASIRKSGELTAPNEITWTITANPEDAILNKAKVMDSIASGQELIGGSVTIGGKQADASNYTFAGGTLTCNFSSTITSRQIITLKTKVLDSEFSGAAEGATLHESNQATLSHDDTSVASNQSVVDVPVHFIGESGEYDANTKQINWTINVDEVCVNVGNAVVTDTLPAGLIPDPASVKLDGNPFAADMSALPKITFNLGNINSPHKLTFSTAADAAYNQNNSADGTAKYHGEVLLTGTGVPTNTTGSGDVTVPSLVIKKAGSSYDPATHQITWQFSINTNRLTIAGAAVTDTIKPGQEYVPGSATIDNGGDPGKFAYTDADRTLRYTFASAINSAYVLTFKTAVTDPNVYAANTPEAAYENTASFVGTAAGSSVPASDLTDSVIVGSQVIKKTAVDYNSQTNEITWNIEANGNQMPLDGVVIKDAIPSGQEYVNGSAGIDNGAGAAGFNYDPVSRTLAYTFTGAISQKYNISLKTKITDASFYAANGDETFTNTAAITDTLVPAGVQCSASKTVQNITAGKDAAIADSAQVPDAPGTGSIQFSKKDDRNNNLPGAEFTLYNKDGGKVASATSGSNGLVSFTDIPLGSYIIKETKAPAGYAINTEPINAAISQDGQTVTASPAVVVDDSQYGNIRLRQVSTYNKTPLKNALFALFAASDKGFASPLMMAYSDGDGTIEFDGIPLGSYVVLEIRPPDGYRISGTPAYADLTADGQTVTANPDTIANSPYVSNIRVIKTASDGTTKLSGAILRLYPADDADFSSPLANAASDSNGVAEFQSIPYGKYAIREISAPSGYYINNTILYANVTEDGATVSAGTLADTKIPQAANSPQTGDNILDYAIIMAGAAAAAVVIFATRNRKKQKYSPKH